MKHVPVLVVAVAAAAPAVCQQPMVSLWTATDYATVAVAPRVVDVDGVPHATPIPRLLELAAVAGDVARAATSAGLADGGAHGIGALVRENGAVASLEPRGGAMAATSRSLDAHHPMPGSHAVELRIGMGHGGRGKVTVVWLATASHGAVATAEVDVDSDGQPDFVGHATGQRTTRTFPVTAGMHGLRIAIRTEARAHVAGAGAAGYDAAVGVFFAPERSGGGCTFTAIPNARGCQDGRLAGRSSPTQHGFALELSLAGAPANSFGAIVIGTRQVALPLPGSSCLLLASPEHFLSYRTDVHGVALVRLGMRAAAMTAYLDALTLDFGSSGIALVASNGLQLECR